MLSRVSVFLEVRVTTENSLCLRRIAPRATIVIAMIATCIMLTLIHKRHRFKHYKEVRDYYYEQIRWVDHRAPFTIPLIYHFVLDASLRRSIIALHSAAADGYIYSDEKMSGAQMG